MLSCCLNLSAYEQKGFSARKHFLKYTRRRETASLLLLCKQGNVFNLCSQEQLKKKNINEDISGLRSCCYSYS